MRSHRHRALEGELRSLEALALDNAGEGCGRELFGAVMNAHQARTAADPAVKAVMGSIAQDEADHAALSFDLSSALMPRLTVAQRRRAREAQAHALAQLVADQPTERTRVALGLMDGDEARATTRRLLDQRRV